MTDDESGRAYILAALPLRRRGKTPLRDVKQQLPGGRDEAVVTVPEEHAMDVLDAVRAAYQAGREDHAAVHGLPLVLATNFELVRVLKGHEVTFARADGGHARVRLYTPDELRAAQRRAARQVGGPEGDPPDPGWAEKLCRPLPGGREPR